MSKELEMLKARDELKEIYRNLLDAENYPNEPRNAYTNLRSQILLDGVHRFTDKIAGPRSYKEPRPDGLAGQEQLRLWRKLSEEFNLLMIAYDFHKARGLLIEHLAHINVEQQYDLIALMSLFYDPATRDTETYNLEPGWKVTWLPEDMTYFPPREDNTQQKGDVTENGKATG